jgi:hypothetical protein
MSRPPTIVYVLDPRDIERSGAVVDEVVNKADYELFVRALEEVGFAKASFYIGDLLDAPEADVYLWDCGVHVRDELEVTPALLERTRKSLVVADRKRMSKNADRFEALGAVDTFYGDWLFRRTDPNPHLYGPEAHELVGTREIAEQWGVPFRNPYQSPRFVFMDPIPKPLHQLIFDYVTAELARGE